MRVWWCSSIAGGGCTCAQLRALPRCRSSAAGGWEGLAVPFHWLWFRLGVQELVWVTTLRDQLRSSSKHNRKSCRKEIPGLCSFLQTVMCYYVAIQKRLLEVKGTRLTSKGLQMVSALRSSVYHFFGSFTCALTFYSAGFFLLILWMFLYGGSSGVSIIQRILQVCSSAGPFLHLCLGQRFASRHV